MRIKQELEELILYSKKYYSRMWMYATAGNLSVYDPQSGLVWITASGKDKSSLSEQDFVSLDLLTGNVIGEDMGRPSAETSIHQVIYKNFPEAFACLHVHTPASCILEFGLNRKESTRSVKLPNTEILKAFGIFKEEPNLSLLVVHNHGNVSQIAGDLDAFIQKETLDVPFFLIENHGITVWGKSVRDANKNLEAAEFILQVMVGRKKID